jgi:two-component system, sensor histidine kinase and response regulator
MNTKNTKRYTVMVVDDIEADIDILIECLSETYRVKVAMDGVSALEDIQNDPPDILLLDVLMPKMDGYEVCRRIKQYKKTKDILVIFVTSLSEAIDETRGFELGAVDYITKPFSFSVIRARIKTHLDLAEARKELKQQNEILSENIQLREQVEQITRHDLKNPLSVILSVADMLASKIPLEKDEIDEMIQEQISSSYTMLDMLNRSLDLYKMENGSYKLCVKKIDILPLLDRICLGANQMIQSMDLDVRIKVNGHIKQAKDRFELLCDEMLFYSMMSNLIKNAIEASPRGGYVGISLDKKREITIRIENQGAVNPAIRERFFDKFITADKQQGTGLGTYSARLMAEIHTAGISLFTSDEEDRTVVTINWKKW